MAVFGSPKVSLELGICRSHERSKRFGLQSTKTRGRLCLFSSKLLSFSLQQYSLSSNFPERVYRRVCTIPCKKHQFRCHCFLNPGSSVDPNVKNATLILASFCRSFNLNRLQGSPPVFKLASAVGIVIFAAWGLGPLVRLSRNIILNKTDSNWKKTSAYQVTTSYIQPLLLCTGAIFICRALDPMILPTEAGEIVKQRLLNFVRSLSTVLAFAYFLSRLILQAQRVFLETSSPTDTRNMGFQFAGKAIHTAIWVAAVSLFMELLGFSTQKWLTAGGLGTVLLTLAGREIFTNFLSSAMIHATRPFVVNEWIQTKIEGYEVSGKIQLEIKIMVSKSKFRRSHGELGSDAMANLGIKLTQLKRQIHSERVASVGKKLEENKKKVQAYHSHLKALAASRTDCAVPGSNNSGNVLSLRTNYPLGKVHGLMQGPEDDANSEEVVYSTIAKLPVVERIPHYTTWIFLDRNQRMADDQSVVGRRRIYYDPHGSEALVCSDSEEELGQVEGTKHEFSEAEDRFMRVAVQEYGVGNEVFDMLSHFVGGTSEEIQERSNMLMKKDQPLDKNNFKSSRGEGYVDNLLLEKSLAAASDSFDNLFCRRCLVFDCRLHGYSQNLVCPDEKLSHPFGPEDDRKPCGDQCYLQLNATENLPKNSVERKTSDEEAHHPESKDRHVILEPSVSLPNASKIPGSDGLHEYELERDPVGDKGKDITELPLKQACDSIGKAVEASHGWKPFERELYLKGLEIFGRNSCFIARNLLSGLKTCKEVSTYMYGDGVVTSRGSSAMLSSCFEDVWKANMDRMELDIPVKSRICRKRGRVRKVKSSWKSAGHPSLWRRVTDRKDLPCKHYAPCGCRPVCGKDCPCLQNGTCCEKYCGCSKSCKNRFRGCHCAKSQCKSRQCPCFAAGRECDPDVCRNCWVSCGDGSLGEPPRRGDSQCGNMKLLLRQQQRILLSKSDVAGWGAFVKNTVSKNDFLGEYTGELISHKEADKRGKIYDRANSSFLFDLNDKYVLDAYRKGDKLKFANHSSTPNCYAKVMLVAGDHRVGIYANERIKAGEELFYDYRYGPDQAPAWARKPEGSKRDDSPVPHLGRPKKHQWG